MHHDINEVVSEWEGSLQVVGFLSLHIFCNFYNKQVYHFVTRKERGLFRSDKRDHKRKDLSLTA